MIRLEAVSKRYPNGQVAVRDLDLEIPSGETVMLVGPSGCGKTTTLKMINRVIEPSSGRILIDGINVLDQDPVKLRLGMGYVIQQVGLFPHLTVADNVATVPRLLGWDSKRTRTRVWELLELVGLDPERYAKRYPDQLSGGQRQRVGVARALGADPPILLMDEPFGAVDRVARDRLQNEFQRIQQQMRKTVVFVTHDIDEAIKLGDRIVLFSEGARVEQYDTPLRILARPATPFVEDFLGPDRGQKRLAVTPINPERLEHPERRPDGLPLLAAGASIQDALSEMLLHDVDRVAVEQDGRAPGILTAQSIFSSAGPAATKGTRARRRE